MKFIGVDLGAVRQNLIKMEQKVLKDASKIESLIDDRLNARRAKDWKKSDEIRDELDAMGVTIKDNKDGTTTWEVKR